MSLASQMLADGAVGLWELAEALTATGAVDQAGNQNGVYGGAITLGQPGLPGAGGLTSAMPTTTNAANKVTIAAQAAQNLTDTLTVELWVRRTVTQGATQRLMGGANSSTASIGFTATNTVYVEKSQVGNIALSSNTIVDTTMFHQIAWTKAAATNNVYVDGVDVTTGVTNAALSTTTGWTIMENSAGNSPPPLGMLFAFAAIFPTALSAGQILTHYQLGTTIPGLQPQILLPVSVAPALRGR